MKKIEELPLVSVIIPIYNVEKYLRRCVDSIINQTYKNLEIILVDDGSPDNCGVICDEYERIDSRVVVIHKKNGGLSDARNFGLDIAKGEYVMFVDSDDWVHLEIVERLYNGLIANDAQIAIADFLKTNEREMNVECVASENFFTREKEEFINDFFWKNLLKNITACWKLFEASLFINVRFPVGKLHEDVYTIPKLMIEAKKITVTNEKMYFYYQREDSIMHSNRLVSHEENSEAYLFLLENILKNKFSVSYAKGLPSLLTILQAEYVYLFFTLHDKNKAKKYSKLIKRYLKLSKKIGKDYYNLTIKKSPHIYEAAYPRFMRFYWLWCSLKNKLSIKK